jgi:hypothetical protein
VGTVDADIRNIDFAFRRHDPADEIRTVCALLASDASMGNGNLPTPDQRLTDDLSTAYATAYDAGNDCYNGANGNSSILPRSASKRTLATGQLSIALARIATVTGHVPSTSTTTAPAGSSGDPFGG